MPAYHEDRRESGEENASNGGVQPGAMLLLKDIAYDQIKERILDESFEPGRFLSERELIEILQMSKTPIKSALIRLESEGFVTVSSKQEIIVNDLTLNRIVDIYELRTVLETFNIQATLGRFAGNQEIYRVLLNYQDHLIRITLPHLRKDPHRMEGFWQDHVGIYELLKEGKAGSIKRMQDHLQSSKKKLFM
jgi:DNA-binding GntR family transcriptional regulator